MIEKYCEGRYLRTYFDIFRCMILFGAKANDYFDYRFYNHSDYKKSTFLVWRSACKVWSETSREALLITGDKSRFLTEFKDLTKRRFVNTTCDSYDVFSDFVKKEKRVFIKPLWMCEGAGAEVYEYSDDVDLKKKYDETKASPDGGMLVEELIVQHPEMAVLSKRSVNTIRVATYYHNNKVHIIGCDIRMGGDGVADNFHAGGSCAAIDSETGIVTTKAYRGDGEESIFAFGTDVIILGFRIPHWDKVLEMANEAANRLPDGKFCGWDIAIRQDDVILVEGNSGDVGYDNIQINDLVGKWKVIKDIKKNH